MRDPFSWAFPIGRLFGIKVRVHFFFPLVCLGLLMRVGFGKDFPAGAWMDVLALIGIVWVSVLLHELGHCFGARSVGGEAHDVLLWPLGGLAAVDIPHNPWALFVTTIAGPTVNLLLCLGSALAMIFILDPALQPNLNPLWYPLRVNDQGLVRLTLFDGAELRTAAVLPIFLAWIFWANWLQFLVNMVLIGFPMDAGRIMQSIFWPYVGYRRATLAAVYMGFVTMMVVLVVGIAANEVLLLFLGWFIFIACQQQWLLLEAGGEESLFGYDFSQGYTSLEKDQPPAPRAKKVNFLQRWLQRRRAQKLQREQERMEADERRMDELLDKIQRFGKESLSDEEHRFLKRVSDRYRNRS